MWKYTLAQIVLVATVLALPLGGFIFGFTHANDADTVLGRIFIGLVFVVLTSFSLGFPPRNAGAMGEPYNAWPQIGIAFAILLVILTLRELRRPPVGEEFELDSDDEEFAL